MKKAILATKVGMTQIFDENGVLVPVTVLQAGPCVVTQVKTADNDGYSAIQVGFGEKKENRVNKPMKGQFAKAGVSCKRYLKEFRFEDAETYTLGQEIKADIFGAGDKIDATATSKVQENKFIVLDELTLAEVKTKEMKKVLDNLKVNNALVIIGDDSENVALSARNIAGVQTASVNTINVFDMLKYNTIIATKSSVASIEEVYA